MRLVPWIAISLLAACGTDVRTSGPGDNSSDPGVDGGVKTDGGGSTTVADARVPPPDGIPQGLAPCDEAVYHSDLAWIQRTVFNESCAVDGCHTGMYPDAQMSLDEGRSYAALVNAPSHHTDGWVRVVPGDPGASMLMVQIGGEPGPPIEGTMPWGMPKLCDEQIDAIRRWIASGAPNN